MEANQKVLERDVKVKKITLNIDKNKCLPLRAIFKFDMKTKHPASHVTLCRSTVSKDAPASVRSDLQPEGNFWRPLLPSGLMHFCSPRTDICTMTPPPPPGTRLQTQQ